MTFKIMNYLIIVPTAAVVIVLVVNPFKRRSPWYDTSIHKYDKYDYMGRRRG
jgi:hypothetical protein